MRVRKAVKEARKALGRGKVKEVESGLYFPTGSTLLNLALTDHHDGGLKAGKVVNIIGDSSAGKTLLLWSIFAEVAKDPKFKDYRIIYDEPEAALEFDVKKLFGENINRVEYGDDYRSQSFDELDDRLSSLIASGDPFVYGLDSYDAIPDDLDKSGKKQKVGKGGFKTAPAIASSQILRNACAGLKRTDSAFFIVSQTRMKIGIVFGDPRTRSGGNALRFYSTNELWMSILTSIKDEDVEVGNEIFVKVKKNKLTGKRRGVKFSILDGYGIDDSNSMINFLIDRGVWKVNRKVVSSNAFPDMHISKLADYIERNKKLLKLKEITQKAWMVREDKVKIDRLPRYS